MRMPIRASELVQNWWAYPTSRQVLSLGRSTVRADELITERGKQTTTYARLSYEENFQLGPRYQTGTLSQMLDLCKC